jgi:bacteriorhodopsin
MRMRWNRNFPKWFSLQVVWRTIFMGRYLLLWLLGIPLPILFLIWIIGGLH